MGKLEEAKEKIKVALNNDNVPSRPVGLHTIEAVRTYFLRETVFVV